MTDTNALMALCPLDGRYRETGAKLARYFSEDALIEARLYVMYEWLLTLVEHPGVPTPELSLDDRRKLYGLGEADLRSRSDIVKAIEKVGYGQYQATNHDVKACEFMLRILLDELGLAKLDEWVHFGCTSEDVNNMAYAMMLRDGMKVVVSSIADLSEKVADIRSATEKIPMLARTHGQPASPTTLGKEFSVFEKRIDGFIGRLQVAYISVKWNGASGNYNAVSFALPEIDWQEVARGFVARISKARGGPYEFNTHTTQIEPHDTYAELFDTLAQLNTMLIGFCQDIWRYVSDDWLVQKVVEGEVGSSAMPHKVNPIDFENAEGNLGIANALLQHFSRKLPISRLQRDLSDSTVERNFGMALGYCLLSYGAVRRGLNKISPNEVKIRMDLDAHPEILAEAYQTILRAHGYPDAYRTLKDVVRGKKVRQADLHAWIRGLHVEDDVKARMLALTPQTYIGLAPKLAASVI